MIPSFLATGVAAIAVGLALALWSAFGMARRSGARVFLSLRVLLTLVGGGIGHIAFFVPTWAHATRVHAPMSGWKKILSSLEI